MRSATIKAKKLLTKLSNKRPYLQGCVLGDMAAKLQYAPRPKIFKDLEGEYEVNGYWGKDKHLLKLIIDNHYWKDDVPSKYCKDGSRLSRTLTKILHHEEDRIAKFIENLGTRKLTFSVKANHLVRMAHSRHFSSCMSLNTGYKVIEVAIDIGNPDIGIAFIADRSGDFQARCLVRLLKDSSGNPVLGLQKVYGDGSLTQEMVAKALSNKFPVYNLMVGCDRTEVLMSYSTYYNPLYSHLPWVDVPHRVIKKVINNVLDGKLFVRPTVSYVYKFTGSLL